MATKGPSYPTLVKVNAFSMAFIRDRTLGLLDYEQTKASLVGGAGVLPQSLNALARQRVRFSFLPKGGSTSLLSTSSHLLVVRCDPAQVAERVTGSSLDGKPLSFPEWAGLQKHKNKPTPAAFHFGSVIKLEKTSLTKKLFEKNA